MKLTTYSIVMGLICFNIEIILIFLLRRNDIYIKKFGIKTLFAASFICIFRIMVPLEFKFTKVVDSEKIYTIVENSIKQFLDMKMSLIIITLIFIVMSIILFISQTIKYFLFKNKILKMNFEITEREERICGDLANEFKLKTHPVIVKNEYISMPCMTGFLRPIILLPKWEMSDSALSYIFKHELTHYLNYDIWVKFIVNIICNLFWWNPFVYIFKKEVSKILEIKCDMAVCEKLSIQDKADYLKEIVLVLKMKKRGKNNYYTSFIAKENSEFLKQRFRIVLEGSDFKNKRVFSIAMLIIQMFILICSYTFIFQPYYAPEISGFLEDTYGVENIVMITPENSKIILDNGKYMLYIDDEFYKVIDDEEKLEDFKVQKIPIIKD